VDALAHHFPLWLFIPPPFSAFFLLLFVAAGLRWIPLILLPPCKGGLDRISGIGPPYFRLFPFSPSSIRRRPFAQALFLYKILGIFLWAFGAPVPTLHVLQEPPAKVGATFGGAPAHFFLLGGVGFLKKCFTPPPISGGVEAIFCVGSVTNPLNDFTLFFCLFLLRF